MILSAALKSCKIRSSPQEIAGKTDVTDTENRAEGMKMDNTLTRSLVTTVPLICFDWLIFSMDRYSRAGTNFNK